MRISMLRLSFLEKSSIRMVILLVSLIVVYDSFLINLSTQGINPFCIKESGILLSPIYRNTLSPNPYPNSTPLLCSLPTYTVSIRIVFRSTLRLSNFFTFKDKIPDALRSCVVYSFKCRCCSASYVGQTVRHLHTYISL